MEPWFNRVSTDPSSTCNQGHRVHWRPSQHSPGKKLEYNDEKVPGHHRMPPPPQSKHILNPEPFRLSAQPNEPVFLDCGRNLEWPGAGPDTRLDKKKDQPHFPCLLSSRPVRCVCQDVLLLSTLNMLNVLQDSYRWLTHSRMSQLLDTSSELKWKHWLDSPPSTSSWSRLSGSQRFCSGLGLE